jgi:hypothetical protein
MTEDPSNTVVAPTHPGGPGGPGDRDGDTAADGERAGGELGDIGEPGDGEADGGEAGEVGGDDAGEEGAGGPLVTVEHDEHPATDWLPAIGLAFAGLCSIAVFASLGVSEIFNTNTPTGGDMGAHVWGPDYLLHHLLPDFRLTGWTPDWYAGFPAYVFYMVVPSLAIVWLHVGLPWYLGVPLAAAVGVGAWLLGRRFRTHVSRVALAVAAVFVAGLLVGIDYNIAFKLVVVSGLVAIPLCAYALGRAASLAFPLPPLLALGATLFLYEGGFSILGGNILSTMAGEFAFSISLAFALLYLAVLFRGVHTGRDRALAAVLFALVVTNHLIPAIFAAVATVVLALTRREDRPPWWDQDRRSRTFAGVLVALVLLQLWLVPAGFPVLATLVALVMLVGWDGRVGRIAVVALPVGGLLASFWFVPFYLNSPFLNDMGWEKYTNYAEYLWPQPAQFNMVNRNLWFALAGAGIVLSLVHRVRLGWFLTLMLTSFGWMFVFLPQYRLWNARLLPFYYLCIYLLAALAVGLVIRATALVVADLLHRRREPVAVGLVGMVAVGVVALVYTAGSLGSLELLGGKAVTVERTTADGTVETAQGYEWMGLQFKHPNNAGNWATYNFKGLEDPGKSYPEFSAMVAMMDRIGTENGCGRAMWEYETGLGRFGTPMAPMMLPYFTDGCIGSMEGLYFEASSTTPFHFINQSELSPSPSRAQRDLPYPNFDMEAGVRHLQLMGVKYYMAATEQAIDAARQNPDLVELDSTDTFTTPDGSTRQWVVFEVADSDTVVPLSNKPVVVVPEDDHIDGWVYDEERPEATAEQPNPPKTAGPAIDWYLDPNRWDVPLATSGPDDWPRIDRGSAAEAPAEPVEPVEVSDIRSGDDSISFTVSEPGSPVLVKTSYFPNWRASGAEGPWRVSPNFMVVVPTEREVTLTFGRTWIDWLGWTMTLVGLVLVVGLARGDERRRRFEDTLAAPAPSS